MQGDRTRAEAGRSQEAGSEQSSAPVDYESEQKQGDVQKHVHSTTRSLPAMSALAAVRRPLIDARKRSGRVAVNRSACQSIRKPRAKGRGRDVGCKQSSVSVDRELAHKPGKVQRRVVKRAAHRLTMAPLPAGRAGSPLPPLRQPPSRRRTCASSSGSPTHICNRASAPVTSYESSLNPLIQLKF